jgi:hypothetical protein
MATRDKDAFIVILKMFMKIWEGRRVHDPKDACRIYIRKEGKACSGLPPNPTVDCLLIQLRIAT